MSNAEESRKVEKKKIKNLETRSTLWSFLIHQTSRNSYSVESRNKLGSFFSTFRIFLFFSLNLFLANSSSFTILIFFCAEHHKRRRFLCRSFSRAPRTPVAMAHHGKYSHLSVFHGGMDIKIVLSK